MRIGQGPRLGAFPKVESRKPKAVLVSALLAAACAHAPPAPVPAAPAAHNRLLRDEGLGFELELPPEGEFRPGDGTDNVVALAADGTLVRVFAEHFAAPPQPHACWERLMARLPDDLALRPRDADELAAQAPGGLVRGRGRLLHVRPLPRGDSCVVVAVEGPQASRLREATAPLALATLRVRAPSEAVRHRLDWDAAGQLFDAGEHRAALARFEKILAAEPDAPRARLGAGLAAFFAGEAYAPAAAAHLERLVAAAGKGADPSVRRDALMYLGLSYAAMKEYARAAARLGELVAREPEDAVALYNFACVLALSGDAEEAVWNLKAALARDPALRGQARDDRDFDSLHPRTDWPQIVGAEAAGGAAAGSAP